MEGLSSSSWSAFTTGPSWRTRDVLGQLHPDMAALAGGLELVAANLPLGRASRGALRHGDLLATLTGNTHNTNQQTK